MCVIETLITRNTFGIFTILVSFSKIIESRTLHRTDNRKELYETVRNKCAASYTILVLADYYPFNREQTFDIDDVTPTREKKKPYTLVAEKFTRETKEAAARVFPFFLSLSYFYGGFSIKVAHEGEIKAHRYAVSEANFIYCRSSSLPSCRSSNDGRLDVLSRANNAPPYRGYREYIQG